jgi:hypothetical protein
LKRVLKDGILKESGDADKAIIMATLRRHCKIAIAQYGIGALY